MGLDLLSGGDGVGEGEKWSRGGGRNAFGADGEVGVGGLVGGYDRFTVRQ